MNSLVAKGNIGVFAASTGVFEADQKKSIVFGWMISTGVNSIFCIMIAKSYFFS